MELLTEELRKQLPGLYASEDEEDPLLVCKFFHARSGWTWYAIEFDGEDLFFGLVEGHFTELGYFSLSELESFRDGWGLGIERDIHFEPRRLSEVKDDWPRAKDSAGPDNGSGS
jgi:hypothetical protein